MMSSAASEVCHGVRVKCPGRMITPGDTLLHNRYPSQKMTSQELSYPNPTTGILFVLYNGGCCVEASRHRLHGKSSRF